MVTINLERQNELFLRAVGGDGSAREQMICDNMPLARSIACSFLSGSGLSYSDGEDVVQFAYVTLIESLDKMIAAGHMYNVKYLTNCLSNRLKSYYRKEKFGIDNNSVIKDDNQRERLLRIKQTYTLEDKILEEYASDSCEVDAVVDKVCLEELLSTLTDEERELIQLLYYEGLTQQEVARRLGIKQNTVSVKCSAIFRRLHELI